MSIARLPHDSWLSWFAVWRILTGKYGLHRTLMLAVILFLVGVVMYGMMYWLSLQLAFSVVLDPIAGVKRNVVQPRYTFDVITPRQMRSVVHSFFAPAHRIDCWLRSDVWSPPPQTMPLAEMDKFFADLVANMTDAEFRAIEQRLGHPIQVRSASTSHSIGDLLVPRARCPRRVISLPMNPPNRD